jgi:hypothetical protein
MSERAMSERAGSTVTETVCPGRRRHRPPAADHRHLRTGRPRDAHNKVLIEALYTLLMICFFGGRADLWPPLENAVDRLVPRPPELLAILSKTFTSRAALRDALAETPGE